MISLPILVAPTRSSIGRASDILRSGGLVAFPTETVYGLGADATSVTAIERLFNVFTFCHSLLMLMPNV